MARKKDNNQFVSYFGSFEEDATKGKGKAKAAASSSQGRHTRANLAKLAGPPEASESIATGTLKTKSQLAREAEEAQRAAWEMEASEYGEVDEYGGGVVFGGYDAAYDAAYDEAYGGYDPNYDPGYEGYDGYGGGYDPRYAEGYDGTFDGGYDPGIEPGYEEGFEPGGYFDAETGDYIVPGGPYEGSYDDSWEEAQDAPWDEFADKILWSGNAIKGSKSKVGGLLGRLKDAVTPTPAPAPALSLEEKYDAEAAARARTEAVVDAYESGVPLGLAFGGMDTAYDGYDGDDEGWYEGEGAEEGDFGIEAQPGRGMGSRSSAVPSPALGSAISFGGGKGGKGFAMPSLSGMGVQVQVPTAGMEKSLNRSTRATHRKMLEAGTGSKASAMRASHGGGSHGLKQNSYGADKELGKIFRRRLVTVFVILAVILVFAAIGAAVGYFLSLSNRLGLEDIETVEAALVEPEENAPYYVLFAADLNDMDGSNDDLDAMLLARIDEANRKVSVLAIPGNVEVILSDFDYHPATDARADGGNARLITALSDLLEIDIAHFVMTDAKGLTTIVDALGGIQMEITQEVDDPQAGWEYFKPGTYTFTGEQVLTVLRADNYHEGETIRGENRCEFGRQLVEQILGKGFLSFATITDVIAGNVSTDWTAREILKLAKTMYGITAEDVLTGVMPGLQSTTIEGVRLFSPSYPDLKRVVELMEAGVQPVIDDSQGIDVNPADVSITVWNGSGVAGGAAMLADILTEAGFDVQEVTNAQAFVYTETLIIYDADSTAQEAYAVQAALGQGRVLDGTWKYTFTTDILVVLGSEWK